MPEQPDLCSLYRQMLRIRHFERAVQRLWEEGLITGEMHLGIGEEAIAAGVVAHLGEGDAMALDHRATPELLARGIEAVALLRELLGRRDGLCGGKGGHMHLFSPAHLAASSGIVGAAGPAAVGFALAARQLRPGTCAVAFFGEGAMNEGVMHEAMNLAQVWKLPVLFVCKDNGWAISTPWEWATSGWLVARARALGMPAAEIDGTDVEAVWSATHKAVEWARQSGGPTFLHMHCVHPEGHLLGDRLFLSALRPAAEARRVASPLMRALAARRGAPPRLRADSLRTLLSLGPRAVREQRARARTRGSR
ncbi:MAG: thiamine pyrophosphate-dependent dehydrogenase E1 component subunit alpha, partial [Anaerolineae bacterium]|nr:thiamine pyrophosphate-dependent dehydrogenase E1 component subunit alpha [Anaerolineae bacterium]